jgi:small subunit ribosomal protein S6
MKYELFMEVIDLETATQNVTKKLYEGMFLVDSALATADWDGTLAAIRTILERAGADLVSMKKWDERKLAYTIRSKTRGTYILTYFRAEGPRISQIERDVRLSEKIMRALILRVDHLTQDDLDKETPAIKIEQEKDKPRAPEEAVQKEDQQEQQENRTSEGVAE